MKLRLVVLTLAFGALAGCSLAGDITPPAALATAQAAAPIDRSTPTPARPVNIPGVANGAEIYAEKCAPCHGEGGQGDGAQAADLPAPPPALADPDIARSAVPADWYQMVTVGNIERFMPGFSSLSDSERWDVVSYALSLSLVEGERSLGRDLYRENDCAQCHAAGPSASPAAPSFEDPSTAAERSAADLRAAIRDGMGEAMPSYSGSLDEDEQWALARYVQALGLGFAAPVPTPTETAAAPTVTLEGTPESGSAIPSGPSSTLAATPTLEASPGITPTGAASAVGIVRGAVANGSAGGAIPEELEITLHALEGDQEVFSQSLVADSQGRFVVEDVDAGPGRLYYVSATYAGVEYQSQSAHFVADEPAALDLPLTVFEPTEDRSAIQVTQLHLIGLLVGERSLRVNEVWVLSNSSDRTFVAPEGESLLEVVLPADAELLQIIPNRAADVFEVTPQGFAYTTPLLPGTGSAQMALIYDVPFDGTLELVQPVDVLLQSVVILSGSAGLQVRGPGIAETEPLVMESGSLRQYVTGPVAAGDSLELTFSARRIRTDLLLAGGALLLTVGGLGLWWTRQRRGRVRPAEPEPARQGEALREAILRSIAALDDEYEAGGLPEPEYRARRADLMRTILEKGRGRRD